MERKNNAVKAQSGRCGTSVRAMKTKAKTTPATPDSVNIAGYVKNFSYDSSRKADVLKKYGFATK